MRIVPVALADLAEYKALPIDLEFEDYVADLFPELVATGGFFKAVDDTGVMMAVGRCHAVAGRYAYLGSARTGVPYRGRGIATEMARFLIDEVRRRGFTWVGLCTHEDNVPVHRSMDRLGMQLLGVKGFVVLQPGQLPQFLSDNGIVLPDAATGREVVDRDEKLALLRGMLESARNGTHGDDQLQVMSLEPFESLPPNDDVAGLVLDQFRVRTVGGQPYALKTGTTEGFCWTEASFYGGSVLRHPEIIADIAAAAPAELELWLHLPPAVLSSVKRQNAEWSGAFRLYGLGL